MYMTSATLQQQLMAEQIIDNTEMSCAVKCCVIPQGGWKKRPAGLKSDVHSSAAAQRVIIDLQILLCVVHSVHFLFICFQINYKHIKTKPLENILIF